MKVYVYYRTFTLTVPALPAASCSWTTKKPEPKRRSWLGEEVKNQKTEVVFFLLLAQIMLRNMQHKNLYVFSPLYAATTTIFFPNTGGTSVSTRTLSAYTPSFCSMRIRLEDY